VQQLTLLEEEEDLFADLKMPMAPAAVSVCPRVALAALRVTGGMPALHGLGISTVTAAHCRMR
jgi:hypothetical protein